MEIQTFFLAARIAHVKDTRHDVEHAAVVSLGTSPGTVFPVRPNLQGLAVLRRESAAGDCPSTLRFNLVDEDGRPAGQPRQLLGRGNFPHGNRFLYVRIDISFEFPRPGNYRLDITADEGLTGGVYHYAIEVLAHPAASGGAQYANLALGSGPVRANVHQQDMGGWVRVSADAPPGAAPELPVWLSHALTEWFRQRPHLRLKCVLPVSRGGEIIELHGWYEAHGFPDISGQRPTHP